MNNCSQCGQPQKKLESRCPNCGSLNAKIDDILAREAEEKEKNSLKGKIKIILQSNDKKQALYSQLNLIKTSLSKKALFTLFVIFVFIFTMTYSVI
ncbi:MAG: hypothetical protein KAT04_11135 [Methylococcales bacterium]|nr:hypothetical protein [Methylococcales bacterium]